MSVNNYKISLGAVMVIELAIRPKVLTFKHGRGDGFLKTTKIRSTPSFGEEKKPESPCRKILQHLSLTCKYERKYFARPNSSSTSVVPFDLRKWQYIPEDSELYRLS
jgi:hypothetical protein